MTLDLLGRDRRLHRPGERQVPAVVGVTLHVDRDGCVGLVGESGSGKSTLGRVAVGLIRPTNGRVLFNGEPVNSIGAMSRPRAQLGVALVFQNPYGSLESAQASRSQLVDGIRASAISRRASGQRVQDSCWSS